MARLGSLERVARVVKRLDLDGLKRGNRRHTA
jgi:hypothetical protein